MNPRLVLSRLESAEARASAARLLALLCAAGYILSLGVLFATGTGLDRWLFTLLVWALFIYVPLRILLEAFQTIAPAMRRILVAQASSDPARYQSRASIELMVDSFFERDVLMPRIATPLESLKAKEGSGAVLRAVNQTSAADLETVTIRCLGTVERWTSDFSDWAQARAPENIQARWAGLRSLASFVALSKVLVAAFADQTSGQTDLQSSSWRGAEEFLDGCLDFCDRMALEVDMAPWNEPPLGIRMSSDEAMAIRLAWTTYAQTPPPAIDARNAFVKTLLREPDRPM